MTRLSREDWLEQGLLRLADRGVDALTIDGMCQQLKVTKGSFYHHFENRQAFLQAILTFWEDKYTHQFIALSQSALTAREQLTRLMQQVIDTYGHHEVNIRAWAQVDPHARAVQERVDQQRMDYLITLNQKLYNNPDDARTMAHLQYTALIGSTQIMPHLSAPELARMYQLLTQLSTSLIKEDAL